MAATTTESVVEEVAPQETDHIKNHAQQTTPCKAGMVVAIPRVAGRSVVPSTQTFHRTEYHGRMLKFIEKVVCPLLLLTVKDGVTIEPPVLQRFVIT